MMQYNTKWWAVCGKSEATDIKDVNRPIAKKWPGIAARYQPESIYNAGCTVLFWQMLPYRTIEVWGGKFSKMIITVLLIANMEKASIYTLFVTRKSMSPRCFQKHNSLPVTNGNHKKLWCFCFFSTGSETEITSKSAFELDLSLLTLLAHCCCHRPRAVELDLHDTR